MTVRELDHRLSREELIGWMAYYRIAPFGEYRADLRAAMIAYTNVRLWADKRSKVKFEDFLLFKPEPTPGQKRQTTEEQKQRARMIGMLDGRIKPRG